MSAAAALKEMIESALGAVSSVLHAKDDEQDQAIKALEDRVAALEDRMSPPAAKTARAGTARASGAASKPSTAKS